MFPPYPFGSGSLQGSFVSLDTVYYSIQPLGERTEIFIMNLPPPFVAGGQYHFEVDYIYPALHRLELRGWLAAEWGLSENNAGRNITGSPGRAKTVGGGVEQLAAPERRRHARHGGVMFAAWVPARRRQKWDRPTPPARPPGPASWPVAGRVSGHGCQTLPK